MRRAAGALFYLVIAACAIGCYEPGSPPPFPTPDPEPIPDPRCDPMPELPEPECQLLQSIAAFFLNGCASCHVGTMLPDEQGGSAHTPSLKNLTGTPPHGYAGKQATLAERLARHAPELSAEDQAAILAFLRTLAGPVPPP
jgi:mono/diheme cytochrome c family protein